MTGLGVDAPAAVKAGGDLVADIKVEVSEGKAGHHVFHVEVLPPAGKARWFMKRNVPAPGGKLNFVFRMAENDPLGKWTLRVTDVMTGTTAERDFMLEGRK